MGRSINRRRMLAIVGVFLRIEGLAHRLADEGHEDQQHNQREERGGHQPGRGEVLQAVAQLRALYLGLAIYVFGALASALAPSLGLLIVSRFVWIATAPRSRRMSGSS